MSVFFTFECAGEQRRVFIAISCPGNGAYCVWSQGTLPMTFQWSLVARDTWPHGVTFSRSAAICLSFKETFENQKSYLGTLELGLLFYLGDGGREHSCSFQVLSWWPGDGWHSSALSLALWSSEQVKQDGRFCCVQDTAAVKVKLRRFVISRQVLLVPACWAASSWGEITRKITRHPPQTSFVLHAYHNKRIINFLYHSGR